MSNYSTCIKCGATEGEKHADAHAYTLTAHEESSCNEDGYNTYTCVYCGEVKNETIAALIFWISGEGVVMMFATDLLEEEISEL